MEKKAVKIMTKIGSEESEKIKEYLNTNKIDYGVSSYLYYEYYETNLDLDQWREIRKHFNLTVDTIYCSSKD